MSAINLLISVPESLRLFVEEQVRRGPYESVEEYVGELVLEGLKQREREHREAQLLAGLKSPTREMTAEDCEALRQTIRERSPESPRESLLANSPETPDAGFLTQLKQAGPPVVLTIDGKAELIVQDAASYQRLLALAERLETIQAVKDSLASIERGEGKLMDDVFNALENEFRARARS